MNKEFASSVIGQAVKSGATAAEVIIYENTEFSVSTRLGNVETLKESDSKSLGLRVICDGRQASVSSSDFSREALDKLVDTAVMLAKVTSVDEANELPNQKDLAAEQPNLDLYDEAIVKLSAKEKIEMAIEAEKGALDVDPRIVNFEGGDLTTFVSNKIFANSLGFAGEYSTTSITLSTVPVAKQGDELQRAYWYDSCRHLADMEAPIKIGQKAAQITLKKLGSRQVETQIAPIIFDPMTASELLQDIFGAISGDSVFRKSSFLLDKLETQIATTDLTIIDDGRINRALGSRPFDGEGLPTRKTFVIENGILKSFLLNTYTARKLNMSSTGNAVRGIVGTPSVGVNNFYIEEGKYTPEEIIGSVQNGFYVTEMIGFGVNLVTGDYSRGASGIWIENGELTYPVAEVTIAGNLKDMLMGIEMIGNDVDFRSNIVAPTLKITQMTISGK